MTRNLPDIPADLRTVCRHPKMRINMYDGASYCKDCGIQVFDKVNTDKILRGINRKVEDLQECKHERLDEDGICRSCGNDLRTGKIGEPMPSYEEPATSAIETKHNPNRSDEMLQLSEKDRDTQCHARAKARNERTFTLVEQDITTPEVICDWVTRNIRTAPLSKLQEALESAHAIAHSEVIKKYAD